MSVSVRASPLQQHELDALREVVPAVARQQVQGRVPVGGDLQADTRRSHARRRHLGRTEAQEGVVWGGGGGGQSFLKNSSNDRLTR